MWVLIALLKWSKHFFGATDRLIKRSCACLANLVIFLND